jgi:hypothetical protein
MRLKAVLLALAVGAVTAAGAAADGGPGPGGGHPGPPPPGGKPSGPPPPKGGQGEAEDTEHPAAAGERAFRDQLTALGYTCSRRPATVRGSLSAIGTDSVTLHSVRPAGQDHPATAVDTAVKVISTTQIKRAGHAGPATLADLVVKDQVEVNAAACRTAGAATGAAPTLVARLVNARPPH